jgi:hypothetical protein
MWIDRVRRRRALDKLILDLDSSVGMRCADPRKRARKAALARTEGIVSSLRTEKHSKMGWRNGVGALYNIRTRLDGLAGRGQMGYLGLIAF